MVLNPQPRLGVFSKHIVTVCFEKTELMMLMTDLTLNITCAFYFHPEAYLTTGKKLMGRNAAGESFIKGYFKYASTDEFFVYVNDLQHTQTLVELATPIGIERISAIPVEHTALLTEAQTLFYPGPDIGHHAFARHSIDPTGWSICGITHTTSSKTAMDAITQWLIAPIEPWDAIICTSSTVKQHVETLLQAEVNRLQERLGIQTLRLPQLPIIPLGIDTTAFTFTQEQRIHARNELHIHDHTLVVLYMGRLSFHAKAHPLSMYQALESAAIHTGKNIHLIECGWFANDYTKHAYQQAQLAICPTITVTHLDGRVRHNRNLAWASADVFCSLSDNIQETFGITPIEAMAAGLPVVVSDWDGYQDTVTTEVGFRIPTTIPQSGLGEDLAFRHAMEVDNYDFYCGHSCIHIGVDIPKATHAFIQLFENPSLRKTLGEAGRIRARQYYDWSVIIPQYEHLWLTLNTIRQQARSTSQSKPYLWPARMDPFVGFGHYASQILTRDTSIKRVHRDIHESIAQMRTLLGLEMVKFAHRVLVSEQAFEILLENVDFTPVKLGEVIGINTGYSDALNFRALCVLYKLGLIDLIPSNQLKG